MISKHVWYVSSEIRTNKNNGTPMRPFKSLASALTQTKDYENNVFLLINGHREMIFKPLIIDKDNTKISSKGNKDSILVSNTFDFLKIKIKFMKDGYLFFFSLKFESQSMIEVKTEAHAIILKRICFSSIDSFGVKLKNKIKKIINDILKMEILKYDYQIQSTRETSRETRDKI